MNLTVVMKVVGGFSIITILLILISVISLLNLNTISDSTNHQNKLAIPMLKASDKLALETSQMSNLILKGFYQTDIKTLAVNLTSYKIKEKQFTQALVQLKSLVENEHTLSDNLTQLTKIYSQFSNNAQGTFTQRKIYLEQERALQEKIYSLEIKIGGTISLLLNLAEHELAETKLQQTVNSTEALINRFNAIISSSLEYSNTFSTSTAELIENEIAFSLNSSQRSIKRILTELKNNNINNLEKELSQSFAEIEELISANTGILFHKKSQLAANQKIKKIIKVVEENTTKINKILNTQVVLANQATLEANKQVKKSVTSGNNQTIIIAVISIAIAIAIARLTLISITRPLNRVNNMLNIVASGDLSRKLDESGQDEFAILSKNCNHLIDSLRKLIEGIVNRSLQLAAAAEQTSAVTAESNTAIEAQRNQVEQAASATKQMSSTAQNVLSGANNALSEIKHADEEAERVKVISNRNRKTFEQLASEVDSAAQVINQLQQDSASIGGILDVIRGISEQTNLLALNAAIEAARAGEQGRGFAVVADEVRTLASRTQASTSEIQIMIESLQLGAGKAVTVMDAGKTKANDCVGQSKEANKALEIITQSVHVAFDLSSQIANAAEEQSVVAHEISANLESIVAIAEQTTSGSQQTATSSNEVARLAEELQQSVQEFKL